MNELKTLSPMEKMIQRQLLDRGITDSAVIAAMRSIPREPFFPQGHKAGAYSDRASTIGHGQTISQPFIVALMTMHLDVHSGHSVLEIGTGSGYQTAVLSKLADEVYTIERIKPLLDEAFERLLDLGLKNIHFQFGDGTLGWKTPKQFDRIIVTAGAPRLPEAFLLANLTDGGIAMVPSGSSDQQVLVKVVRKGKKLESKDICPCRFVKLIGAYGWQD